MLASPSAFLSMHSIPRIIMTLGSRKAGLENFPGIWVISIGGMGGELRSLMVG